MLWLVPAAALTVVACALFVAHQKTAAGAALAAAMASLLPMLSTWQSWESQRSGFISISLEVGLWLSLLGVTLGAIGGLVGLSSPTERQYPDSRGRVPHSITSGVIDAAHRNWDDAGRGATPTSSSTL